MKKDNFLIVVAGASGVGKGTVCAKLLADMPNVEFSVSATTRKPRRNEKEGANYFFISSDKFDNMIENDEFLEHADVFGNKYGTPKGYVESKLKANKDVLLEIDVQGAMMVMDNYESAVFIFILPPSIEQLESRLVNRATESQEQIKLRLGKAKAEIAYAEKFDYIVVNDKVEKAAQDIKRIILSEKCAIERNRELIQDLIKS